jgi:hypothetical protein
MNESDGWARTTVRCCGACGAEVGAVYATEAGLRLTGRGIDGGHILDGASRAPVAARCPRCGREGFIDPIRLRHAALDRRRAFIFQ